MSEWYLSVRDTDFENLEVGDICRALRQNLFVANLLTIATRFLSEDVLAGQRYDGELISALADIEADFWVANVEAARDTIDALVRVADVSEDIDCLSDASRLVKTIKVII
ncbi:contact-dependent growth inhibition system immunity protein [Pseudomonas sp. FP2196]|uniref:contact-dependent growth inhibition system immunity protein n=1 Tax=Pseudomonas sp. FP2196 TaxID=2954086 RepID=UPI002732909B|nr:contact-dependent growth inhibition system immunity protein [Pseudomonas sp. FP2196]WLH37895.1 contact-dependent growth inhibition system immunity protein [Pseudomonas sp. FP2196]